MSIDRFIRLHFVGFVMVWCLLGGWSANNNIGLEAILSILLVAFLFHVFAYVFNDVIDLPVDRTHPDRQDDPLVRGVIKPGTALAVSLLPIPLSFIWVWYVGVSQYTYWALAAAFVFMAIYDVWGKRSWFPPATDLAQGIGWGAMAYVGAGISGEQPGILTHILFAYGAFHIFLINGIHGGIRDLENDLSAGRVTTAAFFGIKFEDGEYRSTHTAVVFTLALQMVMVIFLVGSVYDNYFGYSETQYLPAIGVASTLSLVLLVLAWCVARPELPGWYWSMRIHLFLIPFSLILMFLPVVGAGLATVIVLLYALPGITLDFTWNLVDRIRGRSKVSISNEVGSNYEN